MDCCDFEHVSFSSGKASFHFQAALDSWGVKSGSEIQLEREPSGVLCEGTGARRGLRRALGAIRCQRDDLTPAAQVT